MQQRLFVQVACKLILNTANWTQKGKTVQKRRECTSVDRKECGSMCPFKLCNSSQSLKMNTAVIVSRGAGSTLPRRSSKWPDDKREWKQEGNRKPNKWSQINTNLPLQDSQSKMTRQFTAKMKLMSKQKKVKQQLNKLMANWIWSKLKDEEKWGGTEAKQNKTAVESRDGKTKKATLMFFVFPYKICKIFRQ